MGRHASPSDARSAATGMGWSCRARVSSGRPSVVGCTATGELHSPADLGAEVVRQLDSFESIVARRRPAVDDPANPQRSSVAAELDAVSLADVADRAGLGDLARLFHRRDSQGEFAAEPGQVSLLFVAQQRAVSAANSGDDVFVSHRVVDGLERWRRGWPLK